MELDGSLEADTHQSMFHISLFQGVWWRQAIQTAMNSSLFKEKVAKLHLACCSGNPHLSTYFYSFEGFETKIREALNPNPKTMKLTVTLLGKRQR